MERALRVVEHIDAPAILDKSPVELTDGYIYADRDEYAVFASFVFKNLSEKYIKRLDIRIDFYYYQNIPYKELEFSYSAKSLTLGIISKKGRRLKPKESNARETVENGECFGECVYIPITDIRYTRMRLVLLSVEYGNGDVQTLDIVVGGNAKRISELDRISKLVFERSNVFNIAQRLYPAKNIPQFGALGWLCCCGTKNAASDKKCEKCQRSRDLQCNTLSATALEAKKNDLVSEPTAIVFHDKSKYAQNKYLENAADLRRKEAEIKKAKENVVRAERARERRRGGALLKFWLWVLFIDLLIFLILLFMILIDPGQDGDSFTMLMRKLTEGFLQLS